MNTCIRCLLLTGSVLLAACAPEGQAPGESTAPQSAAGAAVATATDAATPIAADPAPAADAPALSDGRVGALDIADAWIRSAPPGATALAGYATLRNPGGEPVAVRACSSEGFAATELHQTLHEDGMARMRPMPELRVPAQGQAMLAPGGAHLMLIQPGRVPVDGERISVCLSIDGEERQVPFEVRPASGASMTHDHHHDHSGAHEH